MRGAKLGFFGILLLLVGGLGSATPAFAQLGGGLPAPSQGMSAPGSVGAPVASPPAAATASGSEDDSYVLGIGDKVHVLVYREDDLSGDFTIDSTGNLQLPLIGAVRAANLSMHQVHDDIVHKLSDGYLKDPRVSLSVLNYRPFYILGEVNKPGEYPYENGMNVLTAIALAGGYTYRADDTDVYIRSPGQTKEREVPADANQRVQPGDVVRVKERFF